MKTNFVLSPSNVDVFIQRLTKLVNITGMVECKSIYHGNQKRYGILKGQGIKNYLILPVTKTRTSFLSKSKMKFDSWPATDNPSLIKKAKELLSDFIVMLVRCLNGDKK